jgi:hypothetical protein
LTSDGAGGAIIVWIDHRAGTYGDIYAQRVNSYGQVEWFLNGIAVCNLAGDQASAQIVSDGIGGAFIAWVDYTTGTEGDIYAQRVSSFGTAQWTLNGKPICTAPGNQGVYGLPLTCDGAGGLIIAWDDERAGTNWNIYAQRVNSNGDAQWITNGVTICADAGDDNFPKIVSDGAGGAIIAWVGDRAGDSNIYAQRINRYGTPEWTANGITICDAPSEQYSSQIISDGAGGAIIVWRDFRNGISKDIYAQRVNGSGNVQWTTNGVLVCGAAGDQQNPQIENDAAGGAIITWQDARNGSGNDDIYAQRVNSTGSIQWLSNGVTVCAASNSQVSPIIAITDTGEAIITWNDYRVSLPDLDVYTQKLNSSGVVQWKTDGALVCDIPGAQAYNPKIVSDGNKGALIVWTDARHGLSNTDIYSQRITDSLDTVYVSPSGSDLTGTGTIGAPAQTIQRGLYLLSPGGTIKVDSGVYTEHLIWPNKDNITLTKWENTDVPTIDGTNNGRCISIEAVINLTIEGITIINGKAPDGVIGGFGGGVYHSSVEGTMNLIDCAFSNNYAGNGSGMAAVGGWGGGISTYGPARFTNCMFYNNRAGNGTSTGGMLPVAFGGSGGGAFISGEAFFTSCVFSGNRAGDASGGTANTGGNSGGVFSNTDIILLSCLFYYNQAGMPGGRGGAVSAGNILNVGYCTFEGNNATIGGVFYNTKNLITSNCIFVNNKAKQGAVGFIYINGTWEAKNCIFKENKAVLSPSYGGVAYVYNNSSYLNVSNCTFYSNTAETGGVCRSGASSGVCEIKNSIFWNNKATINATEDVFSLTAPNITYSDIQTYEGWPAGTGNISLEPMFVDALGGNLRLGSDSPCIDSGTSEGAPSFDIENRIRPQGAGYDMGAYEKVISGSPETGAIYINGVIALPNDIVSPLANIQIRLTSLAGIISVEAYVYPGPQEYIPDRISGNALDGTWSTQITIPEGSHQIQIIARDISGATNEASVVVRVMSGAVQVIGAPLNYPNPFKPLSGVPTNIQYTLSTDANVTLVIYDIAGHEIKRIVSGSGQEGGKAGVNNVSWNGRTLFGDVSGNGMYIYKIISGGKVIGTGKLVILD